jgi:general secretion pathway protein E
MALETKPYLGEVLVRRGVLSASRLEGLLKGRAALDGPDVRQLVVGADAASDEAVARALADEAALPYLPGVDVESVSVATAVRVPISYARRRHVLALGEGEASVRVVLADPFDVAAIDDLRALFGKPVEAFVAGVDVVREAINRVYERAELADAPLPGEDAGGPEADDLARDLIDAADDAPVIRWVNRTLARAVRERASDVHVEPRLDGLVVRYRVDGRLRVAERAPKSAAGPVVARIKIMSGLNIAEKRLPQSGRAALVVAGSAVDVRVETSPAGGGGEAVVMRLLPKAKALPTLGELGFGPRDERSLRRLVGSPHGIVLVTGPTGSGKTTTLYACLDRINTPERKILTAEDPIEYEIDGVHQVHVRPQIGLSFAGALRSFLRQDPDVIMVGEIRDKETADVAVSASLTGHLVLSTAHTNDAAGAVTRLLDLGVEPFLLRSALLGALAQRLVRVLCPHCKARDVPAPGELERLGVSPPEAWRRRLAGDGVADDAQGAGPPTIYRARGCERCAGTGYRGRTGIYELLVVSDAVVPLISHHADDGAIKRAAVAQGMNTLRDDGARKVLAGVTTVEEVLTATRERAHESNEEAR